MQMFRLLQVPLANTTYLEDDSAVLNGGGYRYHKNDTNNQMVEYNFDTCDALAAQIKHKPFVNNLRVIFQGEKPFILVGNDE